VYLNIGFNLCNVSQNLDVMKIINEVSNCAEYVEDSSGTSLMPKHFTMLMSLHGIYVLNSVLACCDNEVINQLHSQYESN